MPVNIINLQEQTVNIDKQDINKTLIVIHAEWCGQCKNLMFEIEKLKKYTKKQINFIMLESDYGNSLNITINNNQEHTIEAEGYPTIYNYNKKSKQFERVIFPTSPTYIMLDSLIKQRVYKRTKTQRKNKRKIRRKSLRVQRRNKEGNK